jgi:hypothetical protein
LPISATTIVSLYFPGLEIQDEYDEKARELQDKQQRLTYADKTI